MAKAVEKAALDYWYCIGAAAGFGTMRPDRLLGHDLTTGRDGTAASS